MRVYWAIVGVLALAVGCASTHKSEEAKEAGEKGEVKMSLAEVPPAVRATLTQEAGGAKIETVDREEKDGKVIYETDVMSGGKNWEIKVDADGKLLSKKVDNESEEKGEHK